MPLKILSKDNGGQNVKENAIENVQKKWDDKGIKIEF
jgi:hypothetical protein